MKKYTGSGCYRFVDKFGNTIYIGSAKNIDRRLNSHFNGKQGHLGKSVYNQVARVDVCKLEDYPITLAMEQYLINEYKPRFNKRDKSNDRFSKVTKYHKFYDSLEHWNVYCKFKDSTRDIKANQRHSTVSSIVIWLIIIYVLLEYFFM